MSLKSDSRGITLVELIIAVSLLTVVLSGAYFLFFFGIRSMNDTEAQYDAGYSAKLAVMDMEEDIRTAQFVIYGGVGHKAVEVSADGMTMKVHTDTNNDDVLEIVEYKLDSNQLKRRVTSLTGVSGDWSVVVKRVKNGMTTPAIPIFSVSSKTIKINLMVLDEKDRLKDSPMSVSTSITVRSKGAMD